jgi:mRNA-degrading endonuclease RelE of RelBE toxin-antitoxin system
MDGFWLMLTRTADKAQRKLDKPLRLRILQALEQIAQAPERLGEKLSTPLHDVYSHHLTYQGREYRIAYQVRLTEESVIVLLIGPHENFYKKVKQLLYS